VDGAEVRDGEGQGQRASPDPSFLGGLFFQPACYGSRVPGPDSAASRDALEARAILSALLEAAYGSADDAREAIERALRGANLTEFPAGVPEILAFVRTGLLQILSDDLGPRLTMTLMEDFIAAHEIRSSVTAKESAPPTPTAPAEARPRTSARPRRLRVLLVDADRIGRATLARALAREKCQVTVVDSLEELGQVVRSGEEIEAAILDGQHPAKLLLMEMIVDRFPGVALVVRCAGEEATRTLVHALGVERFEVLPSGASPDALIAAVFRSVTGLDR
jgi:CheY-like chemotaxis protein